MESSKKGLLLVSRIFVGSVFIVSGLVKANDTFGFTIKLEEYFSADVLNLEFLAPYSLAFAIIVCVAEIALGLAILAGESMVLTSWLALLLTIYFGFLTFYSAYFEKVTDCGCFGDAIKFTPWQSFIKDMVLLLFIIPIFINRKKIKINKEPQDFVYFGASILLIGIFSFYVLNWSFPIVFALVMFVLSMVAIYFIHGKALSWIIYGIGIVLSLGFVYYTSQHLPLKDYRPYAVGKNISEQMTIPPDKHADIFETTFVYKNKITNEQKTFSQNDYPWDDSTWVWVSTENILVEKGYTPPVHDFVITNEDGYELQDDILNEESDVFLILFYDISKADLKAIPKVVNFAKDAEEDGKYVYALTASLNDEVEKFRHQYQVPITFYSADETMLKTVIRADPGIIMIKKGSVIGKWNGNDIPDYSELKKMME